MTYELDKSVVYWCDCYVNQTSLFTHSAKKSDSESSSSTKKDAKRMREPSVTSDVEKTPPHSLEEEEDDGVQVSIAEVFAWQLSNKVGIVQRTVLVVY